jgi:hypothetical protein
MIMRWQSNAIEMHMQYHQLEHNRHRYRYRYRYRLPLCCTASSIYRNHEVAQAKQGDRRP